MRSTCCAQLFPLGRFPARRKCARWRLSMSSSRSSAASTRAQSAISVSTATWTSGLRYAPLPALAESCGPAQYFAPNDMNQSEPLRDPHPDFRKTHALASRGIAEGERSLGSLYEAGYLVSACPEKAAYWYAKAARGGDAIA